KVAGCGVRARWPWASTRRHSRSMPCRHWASSGRVSGALSRVRRRDRRSLKYAFLHASVARIWGWTQRSTRVEVDCEPYRSKVCSVYALCLELSKGALGLGDQLVALGHFGFHHQRATAGVQHLGGAEHLTLADAADVVDLALNGGAQAVKAVGAGAGHAHGAVDQAENGPAMHVLSAVMQVRFQRQGDDGLTVADFDIAAAQGLRVGAGGVTFGCFH